MEIRSCILHRRTRRKPPGRLVARRHDGIDPKQPIIVRGLKRLHGWVCCKMERMALLSVQEFNGIAHLKGVEACLVELQDFERSLDPRRPSGADIVDRCIAHMLDRCTKCQGKVLVAEMNNEVAGFATILTRVVSEEIEDGNIEYGLVSELVVAGRFRNRGIGRMLLEAAESYAKSNSVRWLRIGVLAENAVADSLYASMGYEKQYIEREKDLLAT